MPFNLFKHFTFSPALNYTETWALQTIAQAWNPETQLVEYDTIQGFRSAREYSLGMGTQTRLYGMLNFKRGRIKAIRHVVNPSIGFSYRPDFSLPRYGIYENVQIDSIGNSRQYSIFQGTNFSGPAAGEFGGINFSVGNNLEMKVLSRKDTLEEIKKVRLIDAFTISTGYNMAVDSLRLSPLSMNGRTTLFEKLNLNFSSSFDPYIIDSAGRRLNQYEWKVNKRPARLTTANLGVSGSFRSGSASPGNEVGSTGMLNDYVDFSIPWNVSFGYSLFIRNIQTAGATDSLTTTQTLQLSADLNLTSKWKIRASTSYDFVNKEFPSAFIDVYRDLHCWELRMQWIPFGIRQSYSIEIRVKSSVLQDLKLRKAQDWYDY
jgi:hypothetical protein